ncbi:MAG TPA: TrbI/VirB10 family protein [Allosphingosinicella sp.]|jgi:type IV secretion system protein VirB10
MAEVTPPSAEAESTVRPTVALPRTGLPPALIALGFLIVAIILFVVLDSRRRSQAEPVVSTARAEPLSSAPPPLYIPPTEQAAPVYLPSAPVRMVAARPAAAAPPQRYAPAPRPQPIVQYYPQPQPVPYAPPPPPQRVSNNPSIVVDTTSASPAPQRGQGGEGPQIGEAFGGGQGAARVRSSTFSNRSTTVIQGTLIPAVLETAFDSRRPGFARAMVSRDVRGFDGTRVLIPRGSRLIGEYRSDIQPGQKRALINWTRLIRPDGATIALSSPTADTLGRGGVRGDYNSHFFERFAGAILQSVLQIGVNVASRAAAGDVIVALPGSTQNTPSPIDTRRIAPSLTVRAGTSIGVFVARDLDFTPAERKP